MSLDADKRRLGWYDLRFTPDARQLEATLNSRQKALVAKERDAAEARQ